MSTSRKRSGRKTKLVPRTESDDDFEQEKKRSCGDSGLAFRPIRPRPSGSPRPSNQSESGTRGRIRPQPCQEPPNKTPKLIVKLKDNLVSDLLDYDYVESNSNEQPSMHFDVKVEVESCNEDLVVDDESDSSDEEIIMPENLESFKETEEDIDWAIQEYSKNLKINEANQNSDDEAESSLSEYMKIFQSKEDDKYDQKVKPKKRISITDDIVNEDYILDTAANLVKTSDNEVDKILNVELRNAMGISRYVPHIPSKEDVLVQDALDIWRNLKNRETPSWYKCYICEKAWWHLGPFREHLKIHTYSQLKLTLETYSNFHECSIAAQTLPVEKRRSFPIDSPCWKCNKDYSTHLGVMLNAKRYSCQVCQGCVEKLPTCQALMHHEALCLSRWWEFQQEMPAVVHHKCEVCFLVCFTPEQLNKHLILSHSVRSDIPVYETGKICKFCDQIYSVYRYHSCPKRKFSKTCGNCYRRFFDKTALDNHLTDFSERNCNICHITIPSKCLEVEHFLTHTENFVHAYSCVSCTDNVLFLNEDDMKNHRKYYHCKKLDNRRIYYELVIVPQICFKSKNGTQSEAGICKNIETKNQNDIKREKCTDNNITSIKIPTGAKNIGAYAFVENIKKENDTVIDENLDITENIEEVVNNIKIEKDSVIGAYDITETAVKSIKQEMENVSKVEEDVTPVVTIKEETKIDDTLDYDVGFSEEDIPISSIFKVSDHFKAYTNRAKRNKKIIDDSNNQIQDQNLSSTNDPLLTVKVENTEAQKDVHETNCETKNETKVRKPYTRKMYPFKCPGCNKVIKNKESYREHNKYCKNKDLLKPHQPKYCSKCETSYPTMKAYAQHFRKHNIPKLSCPQCNKKFENNVMVRLHLRTHIRHLYVSVILIRQKGKEKGFQCKKCKEKVAIDDFFTHWEGHLEFNTGSTIKEEPMETYKEDEEQQGTYLEPNVLKKILKVLETMSNKALSRSCIICGREFNRRNDVKRHYVEHLLDDAYAKKPKYKALKCQMCHENFPKPERYKRHMRDHACLPIYCCQLCDKSFSDSSNFSKHRKTHNIEIFECDICSEKFCSKAAIVKHIEDHRNHAPILCTQCPVEKQALFYTKISFRRHVRIRHNKSEFRFGCPICKIKFFSLRNKWDHMWEIHKERTTDADCPLCDKKYRRYYDVKTHIKQVHFKDTNIKVTREMVRVLKKNRVLKMMDETVDECDNRETLIVYE